MLRQRNWTQLANQSWLTSCFRFPSVIGQLLLIVLFLANHRAIIEYWVETVYSLSFHNNNGGRYLLIIVILYLRILFVIAVDIVLALIFNIYVFLIVLLMVLRSHYQHVNDSIKYMFLFIYNETDVHCLNVVQHIYFHIENERVWKRRAWNYASYTWLWDGGGSAYYGNFFLNLKAY